MADKKTTFLKHVAKASTEEAVISAYQKIIPGQWQRPFGSDGVECDTLFEFKHDINMQACPIHKAIAQSCYYLRRIWEKGVYKGERYEMPKRVAICDRNEASVISTVDLEKFFTASYAWNRQPSNPDPQLIKDVSVIHPTVYSIQDVCGLNAFLSAMSSIGGTVLSQITADNFVDIFEVWKKLIVGEKNPQTLAHAFLADIKNDGVLSEAHGTIRFSSASGLQDLSVLPEQYKNFWQTWERPPYFEEMQKIMACKDQLVAIQSRRVSGEFFTPLDVAELAHTYMLKVKPNMYECVMWDNCCGTGNLVFHVPETTKLFCSTLEAGDLTIIKDSGQHPNATFFQFDFLNRELDEIPQELKGSIQDKELVMLINPPFNAGGGNIYGCQKNISSTIIAKEMEGLGNAIKNTYTQFMFQIQQLSKKYNCKIMLGMFSKATFACGPAYTKFMDYWLENAKSLGGFAINCSEFEGTSGSWPVVFHMWEIENV